MIVAPKEQSEFKVLTEFILKLVHVPTGSELLLLFQRVYNVPDPAMSLKIPSLLV
jgi:hypothetical protein